MELFSQKICHLWGKGYFAAVGIHKVILIFCNVKPNSNGMNKKKSSKTFYGSVDDEQHPKELHKVESI